MKLLIATGLYPPESGGPATYTKLMEQNLPAMGIEVSVLPFSTVRHLPKLVRHASYFFKCLKMTREVDAVLAQDTVSVGLPSVLACQLLGKKFLVRVPGDYAWEQGSQRFGAVVPIEEFQKHYFGVQVALLRAVQRYVVTHATKVIAPSVYLRTLIIEWGAQVGRVTLIYNGIELPVPNVMPQNRPQDFCVVSVGRLVPWKGMDGIIRVVAQEPTWQAVIVDDGPEGGTLRALVAKLGCEERIHFTGRIARAEALGWVKSADAFVLNSTYEGLSHLLIEAMSLGVPIIATHIGGNPELIKNGVEGLLIAPGDDAALHKALKNIESHKDEALERGRAAATRAHDFSIEKTVDAVAMLLKTV